jgi:mannose-1-phosphate guanylyltransferase
LKEQAFLEKIRTALGFASSREALVTLGIQPSRPDTGYGYIQKGEEAESGVFSVKRFTEKPDLATAEAFIASGEYVWNAGIFVWNVRSILNAFKTLSPDIFDILRQGEGQWNTAGEQAFIDKYYPTTPNISVDFAIMEKAPNVYTVPSEFGWSDLGTWASLYAECPKDEHGNVVQGDRIVALDVDDCLIRSPKGKLVVLKDLKDYIIVDEGDALLVYPKSKEQEIKQVTSVVRERYGELYL